MSKPKIEDEHSWRDDVMDASDPWATRRTLLDQLAFVDQMGWITHDQHSQVLHEIDRYDRVFTSDEARQMAADEQAAA